MLFKYIPQGFETRVMGSHKSYIWSSNISHRDLKLSLVWYMPVSAGGSNISHRDLKLERFPTVSTHRAFKYIPQGFETMASFISRVISTRSNISHRDLKLNKYPKIGKVLKGSNISHRDLKLFLHSLSVPCFASSNISHRDLKLT